MTIDPTDPHGQPVEDAPPAPWERRRGFGKLGNLSVRIQANGGWPIQGGILTVADLAGQQVGHAVADDTGLATVSALPSDVYTVIVTASGYQPAARSATVTGTADQPVLTILLSRMAGAELPAPGIWTIDPIHSSILISAHHLGLAGVTGRFNEFSGQITIGEPVEQSSVVARIQADSVDTGNKMRDDHLRSADFMDAARYPVIEYRGTTLTPTAPDRWFLDGELTLAAGTRPVRLDLEYLGVGPDPWGGQRMAFSATAELRREDFGINFSQMLRVGVALVGATLQVRLDIEAVQGSELPQLG